MNQDYPSQYPPPGATPRQVAITTPQGKPIVTYTLLGLSVAIFALQWITQSSLGIDYPAALGMKVNELIIQGQLWRLFTPMFLHGGIAHIALNMYALLAFGPQLERYYGHGRYLALYLVSGFAGNVASFQFSSYNSLGASTAIFGLLGAEAVFLYRNRKLLGAGAQRALTNLIVVAVINLAFGFASPGIDYWGHIGGLVGGALFAWFGGPVLEVSGYYPQLELTDTRETSTAVLAGLGVVMLFAVLAAIKIFTAGGM
jgi:rhomboid protease GluP